MCLIKHSNTHCGGYRYILDAHCPRGTCKSDNYLLVECLCDDCPFELRTVRFDAEDKCRRCKGLRMVDKAE